MCFWRQDILSDDIYIKNPCTDVYGEMGRELTWMRRRHFKVECHCQKCLRVIEKLKWQSERRGAAVAQR